MMKTHMIRASLLSVALLTVGCTTNTVKESAQAADPNAQYATALANTQDAVKKAASVGGEWRDIRWKKSKKRYLPSAIQAAEDGDYDKAMKLLAIAQFQAEAGYQQAMNQKNAGPNF